MSYSEVFAKLEQNSPANYGESVRILCKIADNILNEPSNKNKRILPKSNAIISKKILAVSGGKECLKLMGFEEKETTFEMGIHISLKSIEDFKKAISSWIKVVEQKYNSKVKSSTSQIPGTSTNSDTKEPSEQTIKKINLPPLKLTYSQPLLRTMEMYSHQVLQYEDKHLQERTRTLIPTATLQENAQKRLRLVQTHIKKNKLKDPDISVQDMLILELLQWFKEDFFYWVDSPPCEYCGGSTVMSHMSTDPKLLQYTDRVELHRCKTCHKFTPFPRYNDLNILLETRRGRCGEWANTFTLCCCAMGWDARFVVDEGDHVWTEVYSVTQKRWLHCDPCENVCDTPLIYESGWNKQISYVIAYSAEDIQDVTWRYSSDHKEVCKRRKKCTEDEFLSAIFKIRGNLQRNLSQSRKNYLLRRCLFELVEFLTERKAKDEELKGRSSGSEVWRLARGEVQDASNQAQHVWQINSTDIVGNTVNIRYSSSLNKYEYISGGKTIKEINDWSTGAYQHEGLFRKVEKDWKMVYLARIEGAIKGFISWKYDLKNSNRTLDTVIIQFGHEIYENGLVDVKICAADICILLPKGQKTITSKDFKGSTELTITATLSGGKGDTSWQHAQLFRQSLDNEKLTKNQTRASTLPMSKSMSESSFLSENFCTSVLGKPCANLKKTKACAFGEGDFNKWMFDKDRNFNKSQVLVYNLMEELNIQHRENSKQSINTQFSTKNPEEASFEDLQFAKRDSGLSRNSKDIPQFEAERETLEGSKEQNISYTNSRRSNDNESGRGASGSQMRQSILSRNTAELQNRENSQSSRLQDVLSKNLKYSRNSRSEPVREASESRRDSVLSNRSAENESRRSGEDVDAENSNIKRVSAIMPRELSRSTTHSIMEAERYSRTNHEPTPVDQKDCLEYEKEYPKIRETYKTYPKPCFCDTDSQTTYPSILKQPYHQSAPSNMDTYPVKESSRTSSKQLQKFVDKILQTSNNSMMGFKNNSDHTSSTNQILTIDSSNNTQETESAGVQVTELDSTKVQTTDSSSTPDEVCFRPIQNFCRCNGLPTVPNRSHYKRQDRSNNSPPDHYAGVERNIIAAPERSQRRTVERYPSEKIICYRKRPTPMENNVFRETPPKQKDHRHFVPPLNRKFTPPMEEYPKIPQRYYPERKRPISKQKGTVTETSEDVIYYEYPVQDKVDDVYDVPGGRRQSCDYESYQQSCRSNRRDSPQHFISNRDTRVPCIGECRCCLIREHTPPSYIKRPTPPPPPIDYEFSSTDYDDDDVELVLNDEDESDDYSYSDQSDNRLPGYQQLSYQSNDQYIDLVQELEETLQNRNKTRVQKAMNEFECKSRLNKPLEKPIIDYEETSESEEPIMKKISELTKIRRNNHKSFPCKGRACCNCVIRKDINEEVKNIKPIKSTMKPTTKKNNKWQLNNKTGEWYKTLPEFPKRNFDSITSTTKDHMCGCTCTCCR